MGVPAFFRWLSEKYPKVLVPVLESTEASEYATGGECDHLMVDMNGLIHPAAHPEGRDAPESEAEMFRDVLLYVDRLVTACKPTKLVYLAVDGVAPRAKMNQQRARRWKAAKEASERRELEVSARALLTGVDIGGEEDEDEAFDSNVITPGTEFMTRLGEALRQGVVERQRKGVDIWKRVAVIISDASVPGEGEHKLMAYLRALRTEPGYDPNTTHVLHGLDADLIMLALATHEVDFRILREEVLFGRAAKQYAEGAAAQREAHAKLVAEARGSKSWVFEKPLQILKVSTLREYLSLEFAELSRFPWFDFERALDDFVFLCFFCGNDFIPHLPSLDIREGALDLLLNIYKNAAAFFKGHVTADGGRIELRRLSILLKRVGAVEDEIFKRRRRAEDREAGRRKSHRESAKLVKARNRRTDDLDLIALGSEARKRAQLAKKRKLLLLNDDDDDEERAAQKKVEEAAQKKVQAPLKDAPEEEIADKLKSLLEEAETTKLDECAANFVDDVRLGDQGWKERYYENPFKAKDLAEGGGADSLLKEYLRGLDWVLRYYYAGCPSWAWYFPFHYAPFASDLARYVDSLLASATTVRSTNGSTHGSARDSHGFPESEIWLHDVVSHDMVRGTPLTPLEQLMAVLPAASAKALPGPCRDLMVDPKSPIFDFYPDEVDVDPNGKPMPWLHVVLLPFVDEARLVKAVEDAVKAVSNPNDTHLVGQATKLGETVVLARKEHALAMRLANPKAPVDPNQPSTITGRLAALSDRSLSDALRSAGLLAAALGPPDPSRPHRSRVLPGARTAPDVLVGDDRRLRPPPRIGGRGGASVADLAGGGQNSNATSSGGMQAANTNQRGWGTLEPRIQKRRRTDASSESGGLGLNHGHPLLAAAAQHRFQHQQPAQQYQDRRFPPPPPPPPASYNSSGSSRSGYQSGGSLGPPSRHSFGHPGHHRPPASAYLHQRAPPPPPPPPHQPHYRYNQDRPSYHGFGSHAPPQSGYAYYPQPPAGADPRRSRSHGAAPHADNAASASSIRDQLAQALRHRNAGGR